MAESTTKSVQITGGAASDITGTRKKRSYTKRGRKSEGGGTINTVQEGNITGIESTKSVSLSSAPINSTSWLKYPEGAPIPSPIQSGSSSQPLLVNSPSVNQTSTQSSTGQQGGANKHIKVELKKKGATKRVQLNPKKPEITKHASKKHQTKKARKITLGVVSLHKRITHAKKLHKKVKEMPIELLKEKLIKAKLIKASSKAPESILRQIAADAAVVKNKAL
jgi:hypothetical protein